MPARSSKPRDHDFATSARRIVEQAVGEKLDGTLLMVLVLLKVGQINDED